MYYIIIILYIKKNKIIETFFLFINIRLNHLQDNNQELSIIFH